MKKRRALWKDDLLQRYKVLVKAFHSHQKAVDYLTSHHKISQSAMLRTLEAQEIAEEMRIPMLKRKARAFQLWREKHAV